MSKNTTTNYQNEASIRNISLNNQALSPDSGFIETDAMNLALTSVDSGMATHLKIWLEALQQANDLLPQPLRFAETNLQVTAQNSAEISLTLIEQLEALPVFALSVVVQRQALQAMPADETSALPFTDFKSHIKEWAKQNPSWQIISVPHATHTLNGEGASNQPITTDEDARIEKEALSTALTSVLTYHYILLPTEAANMQAAKKSAAAHLLDDNITTHLRQYIDTLPITGDMGGAAAIDCHIVSLAKILRPHRVICFDMDSTLIEQEVINELAKQAGIGDQVSAITESAMRGEIDFDTSFSERVGLLQGLPTTVLDDIHDTLTLSSGAQPLIAKMKALGYHTVLISGGFTYFAERIAKQLGIDEVHANTLDIDEGVVTGNVSLPIVNGERKALLVQQIAKRMGITPAQIVCVGDGANDLAMMGIADIGIAYRAKPIVRARADAAINATGLEGVLYVLGYVPDDFI